MITSDKIEPTGRQSCCSRGPLKGVLQIRIRMNSSNDILSLSKASFIPLAFIDKQPIYCAASRRQCDQIWQKKTTLAKKLLSLAILLLVSFPKNTIGPILANFYAIGQIFIVIWQNIGKII